MQDVKWAYVEMLAGTFTEGLDVPLIVLPGFDEHGMITVVNANTGTGVKLYFKRNTFSLDRQRLMHVLVPIDEYEMPGKWSRE